MLCNIKVHKMFSPTMLLPDQPLLLHLLRQARGLVFLTTAKAGWGVAARLVACNTTRV